MEFYPPIEPFDSGFVKVSEIHSIYYEQVGKPTGKPILFLHGGPGAGFNSEHRRYFDPEFYRIILIDQRGCGRSLPSAELRENTTWNLVEDIEIMRVRLAIDQWLIFGGSWGSTLALTYSVTHPERVLGLILRGIFLCRDSEIQWFYQEGASQLFPDYWEKYLELIPPAERGNLVQAYHRQLTDNDPAIRLRAAKAWSQWEAATSRLLIDPVAVAEFEEPEKALAFARIECHYFINKAFFPESNFLLNQAHKLGNIPGHIIQGRYDVVCPATSAWALHKAWPQAKLTIVPDSGHSATEPGIRRALLAATESMKR